MREMRRKNVSHVTVRTAPDSTSPPSTLVQRGNEKVAVHLLPHARYRLSVPANFPVWGSSPPQARAQPPRVRACPIPKSFGLIFKSSIRKRPLRRARPRLLNRKLAQHLKVRQGEHDDKNDPGQRVRGCGNLFVVSVASQKTERFHPVANLQNRLSIPLNIETTFLGGFEHDTCAVLQIAMIGFDAEERAQLLKMNFGASTKDSNRRSKICSGGR